jgi:two-component system CheB/CheR fusion protein
MVSVTKCQPDVILSDYNLPSGPNGIETAVQLRLLLRRDVPVIILTGDISTATLRDIAALDFTQLNKPVKLEEMTEAIPVSVN